MFNLNCSSRTQGQTKIYTLTWTVSNFADLLDKSKREFRTELKNVSNEAIESKFQLKMQFLGINNDIIEIYYLSRSSVFLKSVLTICLQRYDERSIVIKEYQIVPANKWQYLATFYKRDICQNDDKYLLSDGSFRLKFQFMITNDVKIDKSNIPKAQLSDDFENLLNNHLFTDVTIKSADGEEYKVHKAILASRSAVLKAHFEHNTLECQTNVVQSPLEAEVLREVLLFIYSDKSLRVDEIPERLLAAADFYQLGRLKSLCEEAMHKRLTVENAIGTLQLADLHAAKVLKELTLEFIKDGQVRLITRTEGWTQLKSVELIKTIYEYIVTDDIEEDIR